MASNRSGSGVLQHLLHVEDGLTKHASDPTFPNLSWIGDIGAERTLLGDALIKANASRSTWRSDAGAARAELTRAEALLEKYVSAIQAWAGKRSDLLRDFGLTPHKVTRKRTTHTGATGHTRSHRGAAHGAAGSSGSAPAPAEGSSSSGGGEPAGSASTGAPTGGK